MLTTDTATEVDTGLQDLPSGLQYALGLVAVSLVEEEDWICLLYTSDAADE